MSPLLLAAPYALAAAVSLAFAAAPPSPEQRKLDALANRLVLSATPGLLTLDCSQSMTNVGRFEYSCLVQGGTQMRPAFQTSQLGPDFAHVWTKEKSQGQLVYLPLAKGLLGAPDKHKELDVDAKTFAKLQEAGAVYGILELKAAVRAAQHRLSMAAQRESAEKQRSLFERLVR